MIQKWVLKSVWLCRLDSNGLGHSVMEYFCKDCNELSSSNKGGGGISWRATQAEKFQKRPRNTELIDWLIDWLID
jgi:hypothetical protein